MQFRTALIAGSAGVAFACTLRFTRIRFASRITNKSQLRPDVVERLCSTRRGAIGALGVPLLFNGLRDTSANRVALIVVDMQVNFFPLCPMNHDIVPHINRAANALRARGGHRRGGGLPGRDTHGAGVRA